MFKAVTWAKKRYNDFVECENYSKVLQIPIIVYKYLHGLLKIGVETVWSDKVDDLVYCVIHWLFIAHHCSRWISKEFGKHASDPS